MTNEDLRNKFLQFVVKLNDSGDLNLLSQDDSFKEELISKFRNDFESLQNIIKNSRAGSAYSPKILEAILNNGVDIHSHPGKLDLIRGWYSQGGRSYGGEFFGYNTIYFGENVGYNIAQTLTVSIARIVLQNPNLLEKQVYGADKENLLHSLVNTVFVYLSPDGCFSRDSAHTKWESCKKHLSQLFTLMVFINPKSLEQKCSDLERDEKTPMELFSHYLLSRKRKYQYVPEMYNDLFGNLEEIYNNFQQIIELSKDNSNTLSRKIKELINYINSIQPSSQIDSSKLNSIISEIKDQIKTQGNSPAEKYIIDVGNLLIENLPTILLDRHIRNLRSFNIKIFNTNIKIFDTFYYYNTGNIRECINPLNFDAIFTILKRCDSQTSYNFMKAVTGDFFEEIDKKLTREVLKTVELLNTKPTNLYKAVSHINQTKELFEKLTKDAQDFLIFKKFFEDNPAPHEPISQKRLDREGRLENIRSLKDQRKVKIQENEKISEEALMDIQEKLKSEKAQEKALPLKENNQNGFKITTMLVITFGIASASVITGIYFESFIAATVAAAILTIAACCIGYCCNSKVDSQFTSPQAEGNVGKLAAQTNISHGQYGLA